MVGPGLLRRGLLIGASVFAIMWAPMHAGAQTLKGWPDAPTVPRTKYEWVAQDAWINGLPSRILKFDSELSPQELKEFLRQQWTREYRAGVRTYAAVGADVVSTVDNDHQLAMQIRPGNQGGSTGTFSITKPAEIKKDYTPSAWKQYSDTQVSQVMESIDGPKRSLWGNLMSSAGFRINVDRWRSEWVRQGYQVTGEAGDDKSLRNKSWVGYFDKANKSVEMTISEMPSGGRVNIVINQTGPVNGSLP